MAAASRWNFVVASLACSVINTLLLSYTLVTYALWSQAEQLAVHAAHVCAVAHLLVHTVTLYDLRDEELALTVPLYSVRLSVLPS